MILADDGGVGGFFAGLIALGVLMLAIAWIVFPFIVIGKFNALITEVRYLRTELKMRRDADKAEAAKDGGHRPPLQPMPTRAEIASQQGSTPEAPPAPYKIDL